jgi:hypothetical protein
MKIKFIASDEHTREVKLPPEPASRYIPEWWKEMPIYSNNRKKFDLDRNATVTAKRCFPLLDSITTGYIVPLWSDVLVTTNTDGSPYIKWATQNDVLDTWSVSQVANYEIPEGYDSLVFKNLHGWIIETPKNYSCYITHPVGFPNLPFRSIGGVVDTDTYKGLINVPFVVKKGFEGIIEKGTPMFQILPFKRDNWESEISSQTLEKTNFELEKFYTRIVSPYGRFFRSKKEYK